MNKKDQEKKKRLTNTHIKKEKINELLCFEFHILSYEDQRRK